MYSLLLSCLLFQFSIVLESQQPSTTPKPYEPAEQDTTPASTLDTLSKQAPPGMRRADPPEVLRTQYQVIDNNYNLTPNEYVRQYLHTWLGMGKHDELRFVKKRTYNSSQYDTAYYYQQYHKGIKVYGADMLINGKGGKVAGVIDWDLARGIDVDTNKCISLEHAFEIAIAKTKEQEKNEIIPDDWPDFFKNRFKPENRRANSSFYRHEIASPLVTEEEAARGIRNNNYVACYVLIVSTYAPLNGGGLIFYISLKDGEIIKFGSAGLESCSGCPSLPTGVNTITTSDHPCLKKCLNKNNGDNADTDPTCTLLPQPSDGCGSSYSSTKVPTLFYGCRSITAQQCGDAFKLLSDAATYAPIEVSLACNTAISGNTLPKDIKIKSDDNCLFKDLGVLDNHHDLSGVTAYWAAHKVYAFYKENGIDSYDDAGSLLRIHLNSGLTVNNAVWWPSPTTHCSGYTDANTIQIGAAYSSTIWPNVSVDVIGHEFTHGFLYNYIGFPSNYIQSRALHEGIADIMGDFVEHWCVNNQHLTNWDWIHGEDNRNAPVRYADCPSASQVPIGGGYMSQADTYKGTTWLNSESLSDQTKTAYIKAGVVAYWAFMLGEGCSGGVSTGVNELGDAYTVNKLGMSNFKSLIFKTFERLSENKFTFIDYPIFMAATDQAAIDVFGECSQNYKNVVDAWYAVGLGEQYQQDANCLCEVNGGDINHDSYYINSVTLGNTTRITFDDDGYCICLSGNSNEQFTAMRGCYFDPELIAKHGDNTIYGTTMDPLYWKIWIDNNYDGDFSPSEIVYTHFDNGLYLPISLPPILDTLTLLTDTEVRNVMRVAMRVGAAIPNDGCEDFQNGEVEDHTINIIKYVPANCPTKNLIHNKRDDSHLTQTLFINNNKIVCQFNDNNPQQAKLLLVSYNGQINTKENVLLMPGENTLPLPQNNNLLNGMYIVVLQTLNKTYSGKWFKAN